MASEDCPAAHAWAAEKVLPPTHPRRVASGQSSGLSLLPTRDQQGFLCCPRVGRRASSAGHAWPAGLRPRVARRVFPAGHAWPAGLAQAQQQSEVPRCLGVSPRRARRELVGATTSNAGVATERRRVNPAEPGAFRPFARPPAKSPKPRQQPNQTIRREGGLSLAVSAGSNAHARWHARAD